MHYGFSGMANFVIGRLGKGGGGEEVYGGGHGETRG